MRLYKTQYSFRISGNRGYDSNRVRFRVHMIRSLLVCIYSNTQFSHAYNAQFSCAYDTKFVGVHIICSFRHAYNTQFSRAYNTKFVGVHIIRSFRVHILCSFCEHIIQSLLVCI